MASLLTQIKSCIEQKLDAGFQKFIICPFGDVGMQVKCILNNAYGIKEEYILDNYLCKYNIQIKSVEFLSKLDSKQYCVILSSTNKDIYETLKQNISKYFPDESIAEFYVKPLVSSGITKIGKHSYGSLCEDNPIIESIGAFCSFAPGVAVVGNHEMKYITTHPMLYTGQSIVGYESDYRDYSNTKWFFPGVHPKGE